MLKSKLLLLTLAGLFCVGASATPIGSFNVNGGSSGNVSVGLTGIDWWPLGTDTGALVVVTGGTGIFAGLATTTGTIHDLSASPLDQPVGTTFSLPLFLVVSTGPLSAWGWTATDIFPGMYSNAACSSGAAGASCTPSPLPGDGLSPFNLVNTAEGGSTAGFVMKGTATDGIGTLYGFTANFTTQFGVPYTDYLPGILGGTAAVSSWSGTVSVNPVPEIPEPATFFLISAGLIGVGLIRRVLR